jgi:hypothetical protein
LLGYVLGVAESASIEVGLSQDMRIRNYWWVMDHQIAIRNNRQV